ncbi:MAG TPA: IS66 family transposase, partial [Saprospiraceae bacterium]|nr:IS66 family transposase [Saprospiraceae bacterium]
LVLAQGKQIAAQGEQLVIQGERIKTLEKRIEELERKNARSAAPFSKNKRKNNPKKPGRKKGEGNFENRQAPDESQMGQIEEVELKDEMCCCGGLLTKGEFELVSVTDIPLKAPLEIKGYFVETKCCMACGKKHRAQHAQVAEDQYGATAHRMGDRLRSIGHCLHYEDGIPQRKVVGVLKKLTGIEITQGMLSQDATKLGCEDGNVKKASELIRESIAVSERVNTDDTGWRTGGKGSFLMGFETPDAVYYQIRERHRNEEVRQVIPSDYQGVMGTDRGKSYDAKALLGVKQQKCLSHIQRNLTDVAQTKTGKVKWFSSELKSLLAAANDLWNAHRKEEITFENYLASGKIIAQQITHHLRDRILKDADNQRLLNELGTHHDRGNLLRFLEDPSIEPTNNRAERALRGAVIARKVSQCSKNERGAEARTAFMSVIKTLKKRGQDIREGLIFVMRTGLMPDFSP